MLRLGGLSLPSPVIMAPMCGITTAPFRRCVRSLGPYLCYTEMVSADGLHYNPGKTTPYMEFDRREQPLGVQFFGHRHETLAEAVRFAVAFGFDTIDLNCGCSVRKVVKTGGGAALLREPTRLAALIRTMKTAGGSVPVTVKIRAGFDHSCLNYVEIGYIAQEEGVDAIVFHPRTRSQGFSGSADWSYIADLKSRLRVPVIGNGDIRCAEDAERMRRETACDGVMVARGAVGNPWLLTQCHAAMFGKPVDVPTRRRRLDGMRAHFQENITVWGRSKRAVNEFKSHLAAYCRGLPNAAAFRGAFMTASDADEAERLISDYIAGTADE